MLEFKANLCSICKRKDILTAHTLKNGNHYYMCFHCMTELFGIIVDMLSEEGKIAFEELLERKANG